MAKIDLSKAPKSKFPRNINPMLATPIAESFDRDGWLFEIKWDGYRAIAELNKGLVHLYSRNGLSFNAKFRPIVESLKKIKHDAVLDGEVVAVDEKGISRFQLLQTYEKTAFGRLFYYVFDILYLDGRDLKKLPLIERKKILADILSDSSNIKLSDHIEKQGVKFFAAAQKQGLEGVMAKDAASPYRPGVRGSDWLKIKTRSRQEAVIVGFTEPRRTRQYFGALVLGVYEKNKLVYIGHTGGGFNQKSLAQTYAKMKSLARKVSAFESVPKTNAPVHWLKPELVCEVEFQEWTDEGIMRQPIFVGLREDKSAKDVVRELPKPAATILASDFGQHLDKEKGTITVIGGRQLKLSNLDKVYWPKEKYTKGDVINYYRSIAPFILPYLKDRPESLNRHPHGIEGKNFFQKDVAGLLPDWVKTAKIYSDSDKKELEQLVCQNEATLIYMANLGCVEINPWLSRVRKLDYPDFVLMDLDPESVPFHKVVKTALVLREIFEAADIPSFCKTSGGRGLHVCVPLGAKYTFEQAREFAEIVSIIAMGQIPEFTSIARSPSRRQGKVYFDFLQNHKCATVVAPYSLRPRPGANVATPLKWSEVVPGLDPSSFNIKNTAKRLEKMGDIFKPILGKGIDLKKALINLEKNRR